MYHLCNDDDDKLHYQLELIVNNIDDDTLTFMFQICKKRNTLKNLIKFMTIEKMAAFFLDCSEKKDYSTINMILK